MHLPAPAVQSPSAGFLIFDAENRSVWANETLARFLGVRRDELLGLKRPDLHIFLWERAPAAEETEGDCYLAPAAGRAERWLSVRILPIHSGPFAGGLIQQFVDITEGKRLRSQIEGGARRGWGQGEVQETPLPYAVGDFFPFPGSIPAPKKKILPKRRVLGGDDPFEPPLSRFTVNHEEPSPPLSADPSAEPCRALLDHIDLGVLVVDRTLSILLANAAAGRLAGHSPQGLIGRKCHSAMTGRDELCPNCPGARALAAGRPVQTVVERSSEGGRRSFLLKAFPLPQECFALLMEDITERKRGEDELREAFAEAGRSRDWIDSILRSVADGLIVTDGEGRILLMNGAAEKLLGVRQPLLFQAEIEDCIADRRLLKRFREAVEVREDGARFEYEVAHSGGTRVLTVGISQVREGGESRGTVFLLQDITHQRELDRMKNEFISTAAHELRTPLTSILGFSELLLTRDDLPGDQQEDFLRFIHQKAENLSRIISDLLDVSRIEAGRGLELNREQCRIDHLMRETVEPYRKCSARHSLEVVLPPSDVVLNIDRGKIIQVLENLLSNAFKYSPRGGLVRVSTSLARGAYLISVEDQGIGMSREQISRAFDKFYRGDSSNAAVEGTGLGLAITKYIVEAHGGRIWLESRRGKGTTASFTLPLPPESSPAREPLPGDPPAGI